MAGAADTIGLRESRHTEGPLELVAALQHQRRLLRAAHATELARLERLRSEHARLAALLRPHAAAVRLGGRTLPRLLTLSRLQALLLEEPGFAAPLARLREIAALVLQVQPNAATKSILATTIRSLEAIIAVLRRRAER
jgi:hypothetical protein